MKKAPLQMASTPMEQDCVVAPEEEDLLAPFRTVVHSTVKKMNESIFNGKWGISVVPPQCKEETRDPDANDEYPRVGRGTYGVVLKGAVVSTSGTPLRYREEPVALKIQPCETERSAKQDISTEKAVYQRFCPDGLFPHVHGVFLAEVAVESASYPSGMEDKSEDASPEEEEKKKKNVWAIVTLMELGVASLSAVWKAGSPLQDMRGSIAEELPTIRSALEHMFDHGFVHGDVKTGNVLVFRDSTRPSGVRLTLTDPGLSCPVSDKAASPHTKSMREMAKRCLASSAAAVWAFHSRNKELKRMERERHHLYNAPFFVPVDLTDGKVFYTSRDNNIYLTPACIKALVEDAPAAFSYGDCPLAVNDLLGLRFMEWLVLTGNVPNPAHFTERYLLVKYHPAEYLEAVSCTGTEWYYLIRDL